MSLAEVPLVFVLAGLVAYVVLGGADFGAGFWTLFAGRDAEPVREHAHRAMAPVWEANHVWLIFVLVVAWTAYPSAFGSIASTLSVPFFIAGVGIILRGGTYVVRSAPETSAAARFADPLFAVASILTPFALGTIVGGIASGRVPVGNAAGSLATSWLNPTSALVGAIGVAAGAYLAAVYLAGDARRVRDTRLEAAFRVRALAAAVGAGALAVAGLAVVHGDAPRLWHGLTHGGGLACVVVSAACGIATFALVALSRYEPARATSTLAVAAVVAGWALAQRPYLLPSHLTIQQAAAGRATLWAVVITAAIAAVVLVPSLGLLFTLVLRGLFDPGTAPPPAELKPARPARAQALAATAAAALVAGVGLVVFTEGWPRAIGVASLLTFVATGFLALALPPEETGEGGALHLREPRAPT